MNQRGRTPAPRWREAPPPARPCGTKGLREAWPARSPGPTNVRAGPQGPSGALPGLRDPPPPRPGPPRSLEMDTRRPRRARTRTRAHAGHKPRAGPKPRHPGGLRTLDSDSAVGVRDEGGRRRPPGGAAGAGTALTRQCRRSVSSTRCSPAPAAAARAASAASGRAGGRTRGLGAAVLGAGSALPPRAPPRACALADSGFGTGRGGARGELRPREGGTPSRRPLGSWVPRRPRPGSHFTD